MTDITRDIPAPPPAILRLPREILALILRNLCPRAVHIDAPQRQPPMFRLSRCLGEGRPAFLAHDFRRKGCAAIYRPDYYDHPLGEDDDAAVSDRWYFRRGSGWRNHFFCDIVRKQRADRGGRPHPESIRKGDDEGFDHPVFLPILLACRALYTDGLIAIGRHVEFTFTDLATPLDFLIGPRAPPVAQKIRAIRLSANPFVPHSSVAAWPRFLEALGRLPNLREANLWLELIQPVPALAPTGGDEFKTLVATLEALQPDSLVLRVSVPLDPVDEPPEATSRRAEEAHTNRLLGFMFDPDTEDMPEERLENGVVVCRRGRVLDMGWGFDPDWTENEMGFRPPTYEPFTQMS